MNRIPLILDCDNTMGVHGCDIDDGTALLYLLGCPEVELLGICCSFGNSRQETVYHNTLRLMKIWNREDIPVFRGSDNASERKSDAAEFLAASARSHLDLQLLVTGSVSNLAGAAEMDPSFFGRIKRASFMGGITEPLLVNGVPMAELNFSCDPEASLDSFQSIRNVIIATAQNSLHSYFPANEFEEKMRDRDTALAGFLLSETSYWFELHKSKWGLDGIVNWDIMAAVQLLHPEYLKMKAVTISPDSDSLRRGMLLAEGEPIDVLLPELKNPEPYREHIYQTILNAKVHL